MLELGPDEINRNELTRCQRDAAAGVYTDALAGFVRWFAARFDEVRSGLGAEIEALREQVTSSDGHRRTPVTIANLAVGLRYWLQYAEQSGALTESEVRELWARGWAALRKAADTQLQHQVASEPTTRFLELLRGAIASGQAHLASANGHMPEQREPFGWRPPSEGTGAKEWRAQGERIGWLEGEELYLEPEASYAAAQRMARESGDWINVGQKTLHKRLNEQELLALTDTTRQTLTVRRTLEGARRSVLHLNLSCLLITESDQSDHHEEPNEVQLKSPSHTADSVGVDSGPAASRDLAAPARTDNPTVNGTSDVCAEQSEIPWHSLRGQVGQFAGGTHQKAGAAKTAILFEEFTGFPKILPGFGVKRCGPYEDCADCSEGTFVRYGVTPLCRRCATNRVVRDAEKALATEPAERT